MYRLLLLCLFTPTYPMDNILRRHANSPRPELTHSVGTGTSPYLISEPDLLLLKSQYFTYRVINELQKKYIRRLERLVKELEEALKEKNG